MDVNYIEQEAQAAGSLNHPNILTIHDVGNHEGMPYLVSERSKGKHFGAGSARAVYQYRRQQNGRFRLRAVLRQRTRLVVSLFLFYGSGRV